jgi:hypothetical protein
LNNSFCGDWNEEEHGMADPRAKASLGVENPGLYNMNRMVTTYSIAVTEPKSPGRKEQKTTLGALQAPAPGKSGKSKSPNSGRRNKNRRSQTMSVADPNPMANSVLNRQGAGSISLKGTQELVGDKFLAAQLDPKRISMDPSPGKRSRKLSRQVSKLSVTPSKKISRQASEISASPSKLSITPSKKFSRHLSKLSITPSKKISRHLSKISVTPSKKISRHLSKLSGSPSGKISGGSPSGISSDFSPGDALSKNSKKIKRNPGFGKKLDEIKRSPGSFNELKSKKPISVVVDSQGRIKSHARSNMSIAISTSPLPIRQANRPKIKKCVTETGKVVKEKEQLSNAQKDTEYSVENDKDDPLYNLGETPTMAVQKKRTRKNS